METTKNEMTNYAKNFFYNLKNYLNTNLYFYGSIQRVDYFPNSSDIDVDIFTENVSSTISKLQNFLGVKKYEFKSFIYKLHKTNEIVNGKKIKYQVPESNFTTEISIYEEKFKANILKEHNSKLILPFYISFLLIILKYLYYELHFISKNIYKFLKKIIINYMVEGVDVEFIITDISKDTPKNV